jgi:hypothetical protein
MVATRCGNLSPTLQIFNVSGCQAGVKLHPQSHVRAVFQKLFSRLFPRADRAVQHRLPVPSRMEQLRSGQFPAQDIQGRWRGQWIGEVNGHTGQLRAILTPLEPGRYRAGFHATHSKFLRACYRVMLSVREENGRFVMEGEADLGQLAGGVYRYQGKAIPTEFNCTYRCEFDCGTFRMSRLDSLA